MPHSPVTRELSSGALAKARRTAEAAAIKMQGGTAPPSAEEAAEAAEKEAEQAKAEREQAKAEREQASAEKQTAAEDRAMEAEKEDGYKTRETAARRGRPTKK